MKLSKDLSVGVLHPRETLKASGVLGALNAEVNLDCDGCATVSIDLRGTFSHTVQIQGTVDGTNWVLIPVRSVLGGSFVSGIVGTTSGVWMASCVGYTKVRAIATAWTSGGSIVTLIASNGLFDDFAKNGGLTTSLVTVTAAAAAAATLTIASPGAGLRNYITYLRLVKFAASALTASATPIIVTTTNLPGSLAFSLPNGVLAQGDVFSYQEDFAYPLMSTAQATATTIVCPATTGVLWRATAGYFVAP